MEKIEELIEYEFKNKELLQNALRHTSYVHEYDNKSESNERLEFLGDTVLNITVSEYIFNCIPKIREGDMSKIRATVICEDCLYSAAIKLKYDEFILLGKGELKIGGNKRPSILADMFEAVIAAVYIDGGFEIAKKFIVKNLENDIKTAIENIGEKDHKTNLQEILQSISNEKISYEIVNETGPEHNRRYEMVVKLGAKILGKGFGKNKKEAEQMAADEALKKQSWK